MKPEQTIIGLPGPDPDKDKGEKEPGYAARIPDFRDILLYGYGTAG